jgi:hypothetical protein
VIDFIKKWVVGPVVAVLGVVLYIFLKKPAPPAPKPVEEKLKELKTEVDMQKGVANEASKNWEDIRGQYVHDDSKPSGSS